MDGWVFKNRGDLVELDGVKGTLRGIRDRVKKSGMKNRSEHYRQTKSEQKERYLRCRTKFPELFAALSRQDVGLYTNPNWAGFSAQLQEAFLPYPGSAFLRNKVIMDTMFVTAGGKWLEEELQFLEKGMPKDLLRSTLAEDWMGDPIIMNSEYSTSHNSIHTMYHLAKYFDSTKSSLERVHNVVEWGGGYGCLAKMIRRLKASPPTHVIIDLPLMSVVQWLYLASVFGEEKVNIILDTDGKLKPGALNLLPVCFVDGIDLHGDLFISTWALSESSEYAQDYVASRDWFDSKRLLIAYQSKQAMFPGADKLGALAIASGAKMERIPFIDVGYENYYAFL